MPRYAPDTLPPCSMMYRDFFATLMLLPLLLRADIIYARQRADARYSAAMRRCEAAPCHEA